MFADKVFFRELEAALQACTEAEMKCWGVTQESIAKGNM